MLVTFLEPFRLQLQDNDDVSKWVINPWFNHVDSFTYIWTRPYSVRHYCSKHSTKSIGSMRLEYMGWPSAKLFGWSACDWSSPVNSKSISSDTKKKILLSYCKRKSETACSTNWLCKVWSLHWKIISKLTKQVGILAPESTQTHIPTHQESMEVWEKSIQTRSYFLL